MPSVKLSGPAATKIELTKRIGAGCFGEVYRGKDLESGAEIAIKLEELRTSAPQLAFEYDVSKKLQASCETGNPQGFALPCQFYENAGRHCCMAMPLLGCSLENMIERCDGKFGAKTTLMVGGQLLRRLEYLHSLGIVHRDIKPENFMLGRQPTEHHVYLIDFGLSRAYWDGKRHRPERTKLSLTGTARYASIKAHQGYEQSRRDDLEAAGYMMVYFLRGAMPWSGIGRGKTQKKKFALIAEVKMNTKLDELCAGHPDCFKNYIIQTRALGYTERPDYATFHKAFRDAFTEAGYAEDYDFDWYKGKMPKGMAPIGEWVSPRQPDDPADAAPTSPSASAYAGDACEKANQIISKRASQKWDDLNKIKKAFESWDKNNDGGIDKDEFKEVLTSIGVEENDLTGMFEKADLNHDGRINYEEFITWIQGDIPVQVREEVYAGHGDHEAGSTKGKEDDVAV